MKILNTKKEDELDWNYLTSVLDYDINTGIFTNKKDRSNSALKGNVAGNSDKVTSNKYLEIYLNKYHYAAHRLAWFYCFKEWPNGLIDHIDGNKSNNSLDNLRECTYSENFYNSNRRKDNSSGYKGVSMDKRSNKYRAYINVAGKQKGLGYYNTAEEAGEAYQKAAKELHGEFYNALTS